MEIKNVKFKADHLATIFTRKEKKDEAMHESLHDVTWSRLPHPDLQKEVDKLKPIVYRSMGFGDMSIAMKGVLPKTNHKTIDALEKECLNDITVTGLTISGQDRKSITITATKKCHNKEKIGFKCPQIKLDTTQFGFEHEVDEIVNDIMTEVVAYIEGKSAQLDMEFEEPAESKEKPKKGTKAKPKMEVA